MDTSILAILENWRAVVADFLTIYHLDLHDPAVLNRPWLGVRTALYALLDNPASLLRRALTGGR